MEGLKVKQAKEWKTVPNQDATICSGELHKLKRDNAELLEVCKLALARLPQDDYGNHARKEIMHAIAKAEGRA